MVKISIILFVLYCYTNGFNMSYKKISLLKGVKLWNVEVQKFISAIIWEIRFIFREGASLPGSVLLDYINNDINTARDSVHNFLIYNKIVLLLLQNLPGFKPLPSSAPELQANDSRLGCTDT